MRPLPLLIIHGRSFTWIAVVVALLEATLFQFVPPAAGALLTAIVDHDRLVQANAMRATGFNTAVLIGPPLGAVLLERLGLASVVLADVTSYALAGLCILSIRVPESMSRRESSGPGSDRRFLAEWLAGLDLIRSNPALLALFSVQAITSLGAGIVWVTLIVFIKETLHGGTADYSWWLSLNAVGGLVGAVVAGYLAKRLPGSLLISLGVSGHDLMFLAIVLLASVPTMLLLAPLVAITGVVWSVSISTMLQQEAEQPYLGRVLGAYGALGAFTVLVGLGAASLLGGHVAANKFLIVAAVLNLFAGVVGVLLLRARSAHEQRRSFTDT